VANHYFSNNEELLKVLNFCKWYLSYFRIGSMAIGGIGAFLLFFKKQQVLQFVFSKPV
jgi:hypothetical protein